MKFFPSPKCYGKGDLTDERHYYAREYARERGPTVAQHCSGQPHLVESVQEHDARGDIYIDRDLVELHVLDDGTDNMRVPPQLWHKVRVVTAVEGDGDLITVLVFEGGGRDCHDLPGCEFLLSPWLIGVGTTVDVVDLLMSFGKSPFGSLGFFSWSTFLAILSTSSMKP
jgi:hypothetical protein